MPRHLFCLTPDSNYEQGHFLRGFNPGAKWRSFPPLALLGRLIYGLSLARPFHVESERLVNFLLQASVVVLGFGMNLKDIERAGRSGFVYTAVSIVVASC